MLFPIKDNVLKVLSTIENAGGEAFIVGGCVRDMLLGATPDDFDVTTSLPPERVLTLFDKTVATGIKHGTVTVIINGESVEVTTYRTDGTYSDSRHPESVCFVKSLREDLARRDFTVNAIAYNPKTGIVDEFGGVDDLKNKILKAVGNPTKRFTEDALRIMRLFRFACKLGFSLDENTEKAALSLAASLSGISRERIATELFKALLSSFPERLTPLIKTGALSFCGINAGEISNKISVLPLDRDIRFYRAICELNSDHIKVCENLKTDKALPVFCCEVNAIINNPPKNATECKKALKLYSEKAVYTSILLNGSDTSVLEAVLKSGEAYKIKDLAVCGQDLMALGFRGKELGEALERLIDFVIEHPDKNDKTSLLSLLNK
ncbi:MAG: hypothetical protein IJ946_03150 [Clostridia bacterium]|nr:hypothetical protein [Clostridia bacterium]